MIRLFTAVYVCFLLISCHSKDQSHASLELKETIIDSLPGECPYLTKDVSGNTVLSWVRVLQDSTTSFCYAVTQDGKLFSKPIVIPNTGNIQPHGENLPKIIFKPSGEIIALWGAGNPNAKNKYSGLVYYVQSFDEGKIWTLPKPLVTDTASYDQRYYDVALLSDGEAGIIWLDNRKTITKEGSALYFSETKGTDGFPPGKLISEPCCQCCRTDLFVDRKGAIHALFRGILKDSIRDMIHIVSADNATTFSPPRKISDDNWVINGCPHTGPSMTESAAGLEFAWFTGGANKGCYFARSLDNGDHFSPRSAISEKGSHPQLITTPADETYITWDENVQVGEKYFKRIGVQKRMAGEPVSGNTFITPDTAFASYPVISTTGKTSVLIAYSRKRGGKNFVACQVIE